MSENLKGFVEFVNSEHSDEWMAATTDQMAKWDNRQWEKWAYGRELTAWERFKKRFQVWKHRTWLRLTGRAKKIGDGGITIKYERIIKEDGTKIYPQAGFIKVTPEMQKLKFKK